MKEKVAHDRTGEARGAKACVEPQCGRAVVLVGRGAHLAGGGGRKRPRFQAGVTWLVRVGCL